ncbi:uracil-DNA glycosylase [Planktosalinus lacus]|uniref:Uracil-DNA glycosylase n=1 Tax=Planktosalinus lacus TaxID=1526573 RepID=A0A8J2Y9S0_9FLAO|nr:uracil-DNA glycosylase [Planktosalinus lacus]GGD93438.1 uracil-DNA glycosylase 2 [Planktosalinus lacus]
MLVKIEESWFSKLKVEFEKPYFKSLVAFVKEEYTAQRCFPPGNQIFAAFDNTPFDQVKVVILGQDPYHGPNQANGLCFSVNDGVLKPPSLKNIFREIQEDLKTPIPQSGNLERWAQQGVFLLNATLTVRAHQAGSHQNKGWEQFTDKVIELISKEKEGVVFLLWGGYAKRKIKLIDTEKHLVLTSGHPSPLSANRGFWFGNKHFSRANEYFENRGIKTIKW